MTSKLHEEEEVCQQLSNATKKLEGDVRRFKEDVQNMEEKLVLYFSFSYEYFLFYAFMLGVVTSYIRVHKTLLC